MNSQVLPGCFFAGAEATCIGQLTHFLGMSEALLCICRDCFA